MFGALGFGVLFALGHHFYYHFLDGRAIDETRFSQSISIGIGTALAFLVKACLVLAIGIAYVQLFWRRLSASAVEIQEIDSLFAARANLTELFALHMWTRHSVLAFIAALSWCAHRWRQLRTFRLTAHLGYFQLQRLSHPLL